LPAGVISAMDILFHPEFWIGLLKIIWVNLLLSGDNAVVIALASRSLPPRQQKKAIFFGSAAAIVLRIILTVFAVALLTLPYLKLIGGGLLLWIGVQLLLPEEGEGEDIEGSSNLLTAIKTILIADLVMSLDNVLAVAAAAESGPPEAKLTLLILGLAISIPIVIFGSTLMLRLMERWPVIITLGGALLGWIAGEMMVTDPAIAEWVNTRAPWLHTLKVAAIAGAIAVILVGRWLAKRKPAVAERKHA
jgi:YjbE family integral membrane protein